MATMLQVKWNIVGFLGGEDTELALPMSMPDLVEHIWILARHFRNHNVGQLDLPVDSIENPLPKELLVDALRSYAEFRGRLLDTESRPPDIGVLTP